MGEMTVEKLMEAGIGIVATAKPPSEAEDAIDFSKPREVIRKNIEVILAEEEYIIDVNPQSVAGATLKYIIKVGEEKGKDFKTLMEYKFLLGKRTQTIAALIEAEGKKWGLEVPSIKTFDRSAGVAGYYAAKRLKDAIGEKAINDGILIVPKGTGGAKYDLILQNTPELHKIEINNEIGERLIENALKYPIKEVWEIVKIIWNDIGNYVPPPVKESMKEESL
jgi:hypothetical protein